MLTRSVGQNRIIDEFILRFTHTVRMDWLAPGIEPTGRRLAVPHVGIVAFEDCKIRSEHIYWDQATVLAQVGLLNDKLHVIGAAQSDRLLDADAPVNRLIQRAYASSIDGVGLRGGGQSPLPGFIFERVLGASFNCLSTFRL